MIFLSHMTHIDRQHTFSRPSHSFAERALLYRERGGRFRRNETLPAPTSQQTPAQNSDTPTETPFERIERRKNALMKRRDALKAAPDFARDRWSMLVEQPYAAALRAWPQKQLSQTTAADYQAMEKILQSFAACMDAYEGSMKEYRERTSVRRATREALDDLRLSLEDRQKRSIERALGSLPQPPISTPVTATERASSDFRSPPLEMEKVSMERATVSLPQSPVPTTVLDIPRAPATLPLPEDDSFESPEEKPSAFPALVASLDEILTSIKEQKNRYQSTGDVEVYDQARRLLSDVVTHAKGIDPSAMKAELAYANTQNALSLLRTRDIRQVSDQRTAVTMPQDNESQQKDARVVTFDVPSDTTIEVRYWKSSQTLVTTKKPMMILTKQIGEGDGIGNPSLGWRVEVSEAGERKHCTIAILPAAQRPFAVFCNGVPIMNFLEKGGKTQLKNAYDALTLPCRERRIRDAVLPDRDMFLDIWSKQEHRS